MSGMWEFRRLDSVQTQSDGDGTLDYQNYADNEVDVITDSPVEELAPLPAPAPGPDDPDPKTFEDMDHDTQKLQKVVHYWLTHIQEDPHTAPTRIEIGRLSLIIAERASVISFIRENQLQPMILTNLFALRIVFTNTCSTSTSTFVTTLVA